MSSNEENQDKPEIKLDALLRDARFTAPPGLAARLAAHARDPEQGKILFWADVERVSRTLIGKVAAAAVLVAGLALAVTVSTTPELSPTTASTSTVADDGDVTLDQVTRLAFSSSSLDAIVVESGESEDR